MYAKHKLLYYIDIVAILEQYELSLGREGCVHKPYQV